MSLSHDASPRSLHKIWLKKAKASGFVEANEPLFSFMGDIKFWSYFFWVDSKSKRADGDQWLEGWHLPVLFRVRERDALPPRQMPSGLASAAEPLSLTLTRTHTHEPAHTLTHSISLCKSYWWKRFAKLDNSDGCGFVFLGRRNNASVS